MEASIATAEAEVQRIEALFAAPDFYEKHAKDATVLEQQLESAKSTVATLYSRWSELESISKQSS